MKKITRFIFILHLCIVIKPMDADKVLSAVTFYVADNEISRPSISDSSFIFDPSPAKILAMVTTFQSGVKIFSNFNNRQQREYSDKLPILGFYPEKGVREITWTPVYPVESKKSRNDCAVKRPRFTDNDVGGICSDDERKDLTTDKKSRTEEDLHRNYGNAGITPFVETRTCLEMFRDGLPVEYAMQKASDRANYTEAKLYKISIECNLYFGDH